LAQREQSRVELRRKLLTLARAEDSRSAAGAGAGAGAAATDTATTSVAANGTTAMASSTRTPVTELPLAEPTPSTIHRVEAVLDWLEAHQYLSAERFAESRVNARLSRYGNRRIQQELKQHEVTLSPHDSQALAGSELQRACDVRGRKFAEAPSNAAERAKQARFLAARGFSFDVIGRALRAGAESTSEGGDRADFPTATAATATAAAATATATATATTPRSDAD